MRLRYSYSVLQLLIRGVFLLSTISLLRLVFRGTCPAPVPSSSVQLYNEEKGSNLKGQKHLNVKR